MPRRKGSKTKRRGRSARVRKSNGMRQASGSDLPSKGTHSSAADSVATGLTHLIAPQDYEHIHSNWEKKTTTTIKATLTAKGTDAEQPPVQVQVREKSVKSVKYPNETEPEKMTPLPQDGPKKADRLSQSYYKVTTSSADPTNRPAMSNFPSEGPAGPDRKPSARPDRKASGWDLYTSKKQPLMNKQEQPASSVKDPNL